MRELTRAVLHPSGLTIGPSGIRGFAYALLAVVVTTIAIMIARRFIDLGHVGAIYLIPVLVAALRWGLLPALFAAAVSAASSAFFFYPPIYDFRVQDWEQFIDLVLFVIVALVTSQLVVSLKYHSELADRALNEARMRAETDHLRDALIDSVSHELRTPLSSILGATTALADSPAVLAAPRLAALAAVARDEADRLNNDIQNLLDAARISSEGLRPRLEWAEPADIVNEALDRLRTRLADHPVKVDLPAELPPIYVDPGLIRQALGQVVDNAAKYSPAGAPISLAGRHEDSTLVLNVSDHGAGLTHAEQVRVGERFFRGSRTGGTTAGSGLGVWIAQAFVRAHGGSLEIESEGADRGSAVTIRLPVSPPGTQEPKELPNE